MSLSARIWLCLISALIIAGVVWQLKSDKKEIKALDKTVTKQEVVIAQQDTTIKVGEVVDTAKENAHTTSQQETGKVEEKAKQITDKRKQQEHDVVKKPVPVGSTPAQIAIAEQNSLSNIRIVSAWESYCTAAGLQQCPVSEPEGNVKYE